MSERPQVIELLSAEEADVLNAYTELLPYLLNPAPLRPAEVHKLHMDIFHEMHRLNLIPSMCAMRDTFKKELNGETKNRQT